MSNSDSLVAEIERKRGAAVTPAAIMQARAEGRDLTDPFGEQAAEKASRKPKATKAARAVVSDRSDRPAPQRAQPEVSTLRVSTRRDY